MHARVASEAVPTKEVVTQAVIRYVELVAAGRADDEVTLCSDDATTEDAIGSDLLRGHDAIRKITATRAFWSPEDAHAG